MNEARRMIYSFSQSAFNRKFLIKMLIVFLIFAIVINLALLLTRKWSLVMSFILVLFVLLPIVGACAQQNKVWKQSYIPLTAFGLQCYLNAQK